MRAYLSLGSNTDPHANLCAGLDALLAHFGPQTLSSVYETEAVGFDGPAFFNLAAAMDTELDVGEIVNLLRSIEDLHGRDRTQPRFSDRTLDIDLLLLGNLKGTFGDVELPRSETTEQAFVLGPLAEIAPDLIVPGQTKPLREMIRPAWADSLSAVRFLWHGQDLSAEHGPITFS